MNTSVVIDPVSSCLICVGNGIFLLDALVNLVCVYIIFVLVNS